MNSVASQNTRDVPPNATTTEAKGETILKVPQEKINLSKEAVPFQHQKAGCQPCLSFLPNIQSKVPRIIDADEEQKKAINDPVLAKISGRIQYSESDRRFWNTVCVASRKEAVRYLSLLIKNDDGISVEDAVVLCSAVNIIDRAGVHS